MTIARISTYYLWKIEVTKHESKSKNFDSLCNKRKTPLSNTTNDNCVQILYKAI